MSRPLLSRLARRLSGTTPTSEERRAFLKMSAGLGAATLLSSNGWAAAPSQGRLLVVGAGFGGLSAAFEARSQGLDVQVYEARERVGGRVLSIANAGLVHEGGAELIGSNHPRWVAYAERFGLTLRELTEPPGEDVLFLNGKQLTPREVDRLWKRAEKILAKLTRAARPVPASTPWEAPGAQVLDAMDLTTWLGAHKDVDAVRFLDLLLSADASVPTADQSLLGMLATITGGGGDRYWTESEVYRCAGGNQQLAFKLAEALGDRLHLKTPVHTIRWGNERVGLILADGSEVEGDAVVCALPPSVWGQVRFDPPLPMDLRPTMGKAVKHLTKLSHPVWSDTGRSPTAYGEGVISMTWDGTDGQPGKERWLVAFSGAGQAAKALSHAPEARETAYAREHEAMFPGFGRAVVEQRFYDWPNEPLTRAGYSCPGVAQVTTACRTLHEGLYPLIFAGEHCSTAFPGYMEGALESGVRAARSAVDRLG